MDILAPSTPLINEYGLTNCRKLEQARKTVRLPAILCALVSAFAAKAEDVKEKVSIETGADLVELAVVGTGYEHLGYGMPYKRNETFLVYTIL
jgi:hypothetical protein